MTLRILRIVSCIFIFLFLLIAVGSLYCQDEAPVEGSVEGPIETPVEDQEKGPVAKGPVKVTWDKRNIYVNGRLYYIKGVSYSLNYGPKYNFLDIPSSVWENDFKMIKEAGINTIRTYEPLPPKILDLADEYGLKVIENICYPNERTDYNSKAELETLKRIALTYVERDKEHPAILMWSIWNDMPFRWSGSGSILRRYDEKIVNSFLKELYEAIKEKDKNHPVTGSNIFGEEGEEIGSDFLDVLGFNVYLGISDWFAGKFSLGLAKKQISRLERITSLSRKKPGLILETGYSTYCKGYNQGKALETQIKVADSKVAGVVIFQWADGWNKAGNPWRQDYHIEEHWGIVDALRNEKSGYKAVSQIFGMIPTESRGYMGDR